ALRGADREMESALRGADREMESALRGADREMESALRGADREMESALRGADREMESALRGADREMESALRATETQTVRVRASCLGRNRHRGSRPGSAAVGEDPGHVSPGRGAREHQGVGAVQEAAVAGH